jgi:predicted nucleotidyltransferase component of viral defense system
METEQIIKYERSLKISRDQILREEAEMVFLSDFSNDSLAAKVVFYGGTALRLAHGSPRFSEDIDLITIKPVKFSEFEKLIKQVAKNNSLKWKLKDIKDKRNTLFALFSIEDENLKHNFSLKIEIHKPAHKISLKTELVLLKSPVSIAEPLLLVPTLEESKRLKENALSDRKKARDIFDLWYISQSLRKDFVLPKKTPSFTQREFNNELQVFLPPKYYPIIKQLYGKIDRKN